MPGKVPIHGECNRETRRKLAEFDDLVEELARAAGRFDGRHQRCRMPRHGDGDRVTLSRYDGENGEHIVRMKGIERCRDQWMCPVCAARIGRLRGQEVLQVVENWQGRGWQVWMVTLKVPQRQVDRLKDLLEVISKARSALNIGVGPHPPRVGELNGHVVKGWVQSREITFGRYGWFPHLHMLIAVDPEFGPPVEANLIREWAEAVEKEWRKLRKLPKDHPELQWMRRYMNDPQRRMAWVERVRSKDAVADYVTKLGIDVEEVRGAAHEVTKVEDRSKANWPAKWTTLSIWRLLWLSWHGDRRAYALVAEYAEAVKAQQRVRMMPGERARAGLRKNLKDAGADAFKVGVSVSDVPGFEFNLSGWEWKMVLRRGEAANLKRAVVAGDLGGCHVVVARSMRSWRKEGEARGSPAGTISVIRDYVQAYQNGRWEYGISERGVKVMSPRAAELDAKRREEEAERLEEVAA